MRSELVWGEVGEEFERGVPIGKLELGGVSEFAAVDKNNSAMAAGEDGFLEGDDFFLRVPDAGLVDSFGGEDGEVVIPECAGRERAGTEENRLPDDELAAEQVDGDALDLREHFGDREIDRNDGEGKNGVATEFFGHEIDGGSRIEEADHVGAEKGESLSGQAAFAGDVGAEAFVEGGEAAVVKGDRTAEGALDILLLGQDSEIAPGRGLGNRESAADFRNGQVLALLQKLRELFATLPDNMGRYTHGLFGSVESARNQSARGAESSFSKTQSARGTASETAKALLGGRGRAVSRHWVRMVPPCQIAVASL